jgi:hypothetical protein
MQIARKRRKVKWKGEHENMLQNLDLENSTKTKFTRI